MRNVIKKILSASKNFRIKHHKLINTIVFTVAFGLTYFHVGHSVQELVADIHTKVAGFEEGDVSPLLALIAAGAGISLSASKEIGHSVKKLNGARTLAWRFIRRKARRKGAKK